MLFQKRDQWPIVRFCYNTFGTKKYQIAILAARLQLKVVHWCSLMWELHLIDQHWQWLWNPVLTILSRLQLIKSN